ncbi:MAG: hypothetical protein A2Z72_06875 [Omnitrophica bacterium RBG_13_46_9]|nr:MAG: hypothetical protein A2Z72_06875 [Omnitrophica bacterium RBG_13_46_9]
MLKIQKNNLVIACVGDDSFHKHWISGARKNFDLALIYYGNIENRYEKEADFYFHMRENILKLGAIAAAIDRLGEKIKEYESMFFPDDDIFMSAAAINRIFEIFHRYKLDLAQPALLGGVMHWRITQQDYRCILRYVSGVEMMCPVFSREALFKVLHTFTMNKSGWGIDLLWSKMLRGQKIAIIDSVGVYHDPLRRPIENKSYYKKLDVLGIDPIEEMKEIESKYDIHYCGACDIIYGKLEKTRLMIFFSRWTLWIIKLALKFYIYIHKKTRGIRLFRFSRTV